MYIIFVNGWITSETENEGIKTQWFSVAIKGPCINIEKEVLHELTNQYATKQPNTNLGQLDIKSVTEQLKQPFLPPFM